MTPGRPAPTPANRSGVAYALGAYGVWGLLPIYWKLLAAVPLLELLSYRVIGSLIFAALLLQISGGWRDVREVVRSPRLLAVMTLTAVLIGSNWLIFIFAVNAGHVLATSLGYFLNPLVNVGLGVLFLRERLRPAQLVAVAIAAAGVAQLAWRSGGLPWISLTLAATFALYGLLRKLAPIRPLAGLAIETALLVPLAGGWLAHVVANGGAVAFAHGFDRDAALVTAAGVITGTPLLWFASAARRLRLSTLGLFQYLAPSLGFALAVLVYREPFAAPQALAFVAIWAALALYSADSLRGARAGNAATVAAGREPELSA